MHKWVKRLLAMGLAVMCAASTFVAVAFADSSLVSPHFRFDESSIDSGGLINSSSANFQSAESIGQTAVGNSTSSNFQINSGYITTSDPALAVGITNANAAFTDFSPGSTATATSTFQVSDYTSYGYVVQIVGTPPTNGGHTITPMAATGPPQAGIEQFGINLVANTSPISFGANPNQGQFGAGVAAPNYATANNFRYVSGETIASAPKSSGITTFTISYIVNVTSLTPGGQYSGSQQLICTGTF